MTPSPTPRAPPSCPMIRPSPAARRRKIISPTPGSTAAFSDRLGAGYTLICFDERLAEGVRSLPDALDVVCLALDSEAAAVLAAGPQAVRLVRPDRHVAARWTTASAEPCPRRAARVTFQSQPDNAAAGTVEA